MPDSAQVPEILRYSVFGGEAPEITDWPATIRELNRQALAPMAFIRGFASVYTSTIAKEHYRNFGNLTEQCEVIRELNGLLDCPVVLKGLAAAQYYPRPNRRTVGDLDIIAHGTEFARAVEILEGAGFVPTEARRKKLSETRHRAYTRLGVCIELHQYFSLGKTDRDHRLDRIIAEAVPVRRTVNNCEFYCLPDPVNGLALLEHLTHHLSDGVGLRHVLDWACYVRAYLTDEAWETELRPLAEATGLDLLAAAVTALTEKYLGAPHRAFAAAADDETVDLMMEEFLSAGNMGRGRGETAGRIASFRGDRNPLRRLQRGGLARWRFAWDHKWVRPFAWLYQLLRILWHLLTKKDRSGAGIIYRRQDRIFRALHLGKYMK